MELLNITNGSYENSVTVTGNDNSQSIGIEQEIDQSIDIGDTQAAQTVKVLQDEGAQDIEVETPAGGGGLRGYSAYEIAVQNGFVGSEQDWLRSLEGEDGSTPYIKDGYWYIDGINTQVKAEGTDGKDGVDGKDGTSVTVNSITESNEDGGSNVVSFSDGKTLTVKNGSKGSQGEQGIRGPQGLQGPAGQKGDGFSIAKTYPSIAAMNEGYSTDGVPLNGFVLINTGNVEDADNAKLFVKLEGGYSYLTDLSGSQGIQGETGLQGLQGPEGPQGPRGLTGEDGISVTHSWDGTTLTVTSASGTSSADLKGDKGEKGDTYTLTDADKEEIAELKKSIIDVVELPTENIDEKSFYRLLTAKWVYCGTIYGDYTCYCVETLPEIGEPATADMIHITTYYSTSDGEVYGYVDDMLGAYFGIPTGWYPASMLFEAAGMPYGGILTNIEDSLNYDAVCLLLEYGLYTYKEGKWEALKGVGSAGTGNNAEVFNTPRNFATGDFSHAEGHRVNASGFGSHAEGSETEAAGDYSHTEGSETEAAGDYSHTEGHFSRALGEASHSEGMSTVAEGDYSHAEGDFTHTKGRNSHAEGECTTAIGRNQHSQGRYNIEDTEERYAHIVGNGEDGAHSNAHTLDWQGNAWFAGGVKVGGTGQDDENAKTLATIGDLSNLATVDKVKGIDTYAEGVSELDASESITWREGFVMYDDEGNAFTSGEIYHRMPIVAGENVAFEIDEENDVVKIKAQSGVPTCDTSNNGQFLTVVDGVATWTTIPNAEGVNF